MSKHKKNAVGMARALWVQMEKRRLVEKQATMKISTPSASLLGTCLQSVDDRYRDFEVIQMAVLTADAKWIVRHKPSDQHTTVQLPYGKLLTMGHNQLIDWLFVQIRDAADRVLVHVNTRTL